MSSTAGTGGLTVPAPGVYEIEPDASSVRLETRALFGLLPVRGGWAIGGGRITVGEPVEDSSAVVSVRSGSFDTGNSKRDEHVRSADYLDSADHPEIHYRATALDRSGEQPVLRGELTVRGTTAPLPVTVTSVDVVEGRLTARGRATVDRYAFGVTAGKGLTGRRLSLEVSVVAHL